MDIAGKIPRWAQLLILLGVGVLLIFLSAYSEKFWATISDGLGVAFITAAILAFTVDRWLKADIAKDVFLTAVGHHLPEDFRQLLKNEMARMAGCHFLCENHTLKVEIKILSQTEYVSVTAMIERTLRNISGSKQPINNHLSIDEWGVPNQKSSIEECNITDGAGNMKGFTEIIETSNKSIIKVDSLKIDVRHNETVKLESKGTEYKRTNDDISYFFTVPTIRPAIEVDAPTELHIEIVFGSEGEIQTARYSRKETLEGAYFPGQRMRIRWWPKESGSGAR